MIIAASIILIVVLSVIWVVRSIDYFRENRRRRCIRRISAFVASPKEFDVERLLHIGSGASLQTIAEAVAYAAEHLHTTATHRLMMIVKFYGIDFYLIEKCRHKDEGQAKLLLSKIPLSRDAKRVISDPEIFA